ncbi:L-rhamnose/proton symporter RhaT [uncultured Draconibacterium sp.]|uniref:L-rhamnose/proton symporter RhaT n=1 Tax=uncultured Draconibacterium sp. TaxID=1573823 RepID=UPI003261754B
MIGILFAVFAGVMLGFWAVPGKFVKNYEFENAWGVCYLFMLWIIPVILGFSLIDNFAQVLSDVGGAVLLKMLIPSFLWGVGMLLWGKAINHIGLSLGFSIFIGTIVFIGSLLPFFIYGLPATNVLLTLLLGILVILLGIVMNGRAGILREGNKSGEKAAGGSMMTGIIIAVVGGLLCTGFNIANEFGKEAIAVAVEKNGNESWLTSVASMFIVYVSGGLFVIPYFLIQITRKKMWAAFRVVEAGKNVSLAGLMAALNFTASILFAYSAFVLGNAGGTIGYAIFNTMSVVVAVVGGIVTKEWATARQQAKSALYIGLAAMIIGVVIIAIGNGLA